MAAAKKKAPVKKSPAKKAAVKKPREIEELSDDLRTPLSASDIKEVLDGMRGELGDGVMLADGSDLNVKVRGVISTQCAMLDQALGRGGIPLGRLTILHGKEGCGKTTIALHAVSEVQKRGGIAIYLDMEYKLDLEYAANLGVDRSRLFMYQPNYLEQAFAYMRSGIAHATKLRTRLGRRVPVLIVLDSMNAAITKAQFDGEWEDKHMAPQARAYSEGLPKLMPHVYKDDVALVWISQVRKKMNVTFGNDEEIAGGQAPRFYASCIINIKRIGSLKKDDEAYGNLTKAEVKKNQVAPPFRKAEFVIKYGHGVDNERSILELANKLDIVEKSGAWWAFDGERLRQGLDASAAYLREQPALRDRIWEAVKEAEA